MSADQTGAAQVTVKAAAATVFGSEDAEITRNVRNPAAGKAVTLSRDSNLVSGVGYVLAVGESVRVTLRPGETLWGRCAGGNETTLEVI